MPATPASGRRGKPSAATDAAHPQLLRISTAEAVERHEPPDKLKALLDEGTWNSIGQQDRFTPTVGYAEHAVPTTFEFGTAADSFEARTRTLPVAWRYKLIARLGCGGHGIVWLANDLNCQRFVAVKLLRSDLRDNTGYCASAARECEFLARCSHPNVVTLLDGGLCPLHGPYTVMERIEGSNLHDSLTARRACGARMSVREVILVSMAVAEALWHVHVRGLLHRDVKCGNIVLPSQRHPWAKLIDFSISAQLGGITSNEYQGTPSYSSPEQLRCSSDLDPRSDLYSLGVVMCAMLNGSKPFFGTAEKDPTVRKVPEVARLHPEAPQPLCELVEQLLADNREQRPRSAAHVATNLWRLLAAL